MKLNLSKELCCGCEACYAICPAGAIEMKMDEEGFRYPYVHEDLCISCHKCETVCPAFRKKVIKNEVLLARAGYAKDNKVRAESTSGGIFSVLAAYIVNYLNGIVYGVKFDENFDTVYGRAEKNEEVADFRGSKYVQCRTEKVYCKVKEDLENGKYVLFSGLPCHIEALNSILEKKYERIYLLDMVCFGIASPGVWQKYLKQFHDIGKLEQVVFKDKSEGWKHWKLKYTENGKETWRERTEDLYMNSYLQRINIRPSCFQCPHKGLDRISDLTIADCWGKGEENKNLNDDKGLSAVLIHTEKGKELFDKIKEQLVYETYDAEELMSGNWAAYQAPQANEKRSLFFEEVSRNGFEKIRK